MITLDAKFLEARELPGTDRYPASALISVLDGTRTMNLVGPGELLGDVGHLEPFQDISLELRWKPVDLASLGGTGRGKAYRLSVTTIRE